MVELAGNRCEVTQWLMGNRDDGLSLHYQSHSAFVAPGERNRGIVLSSRWRHRASFGQRRRRDTTRSVLQRGKKTKSKLRTLVPSILPKLQITFVRYFFSFVLFPFKLMHVCHYGMYTYFSTSNIFTSFFSKCFFFTKDNYKSFKSSMTLGYN